MRLSDWGCPGWLLRLVAAYLTGRKMTVRFRVAFSSTHSLPGGCAMGDCLGMILFLVEMSDLGMPPVHYAKTLKGDVLAVPGPPAPAVTKDEVRLKWVDDGVLAECIRLDEVLTKDNQTIIGPRDFHDRHAWVLPGEKSRLQNKLDEIKHYANEHEMRVNFEKTFFIPFGFSRKYDFLPRLKYDGNELEVRYERKLLGVMINSEGRWNDHIHYIANKAKQRMFFLRSLKNLGASDLILKDVYILFIRSIMEFAAPLWTGALTGNKKLTNILNRVQNYACRIINPNVPSTETQSYLKLECLETRRILISHKCAKQMANSAEFATLFPKNERQASRDFGKYVIPKCNRKRTALSSIPFFVTLLNEMGNM